MNPLMQSMGVAAPMGRMQSAIKQVNAVKQMMNGQNPEAFANLLAQRNPQFAQFVQQNKGKSAKQIAEENGLDWNEVQSLLK